MVLIMDHKMPLGFLPPLAFEKRITDGEKHRCSQPLLAPDVWNYRDPPRQATALKMAPLEQTELIQLSF
uniref:Uncharacterized protein n=1 Tax=Anguilla anguilla TaxID=7936 RepID=A0A0E9Q7J7_ANGAN